MLSSLRNLIDPKLIDGLASAEDTIARNLMQDSEVCLQQLICKLIASGGPNLQKNLETW